ncbi:MAG: AAC(3) family N-acetyltransferase [Kiloniellales bacterium]|nr:AAC(3) family N-acetyltransferase [Kiloniellales bacterium]
MAEAHYTREDLDTGLAALQIEAGDTVFCHSNIGYFGRLAGADSRDALCEAIFDTVMARLGPRGTLVVPTYTYSFPRGQDFDPAETASPMGIFAEWIRAHPDSLRSRDPSYSVAAIGPGAAALIEGLPDNSFGRDSVFDRLLRLGAKHLNFNHPGCTFIHYVERELQVPYRFDKTFTGTLHLDGKARPAEVTIWVHYLSDMSLAHSPFGFETLARETERMAARPLGRGEISAIAARAAFALIAETLPARPWFLTKAEALGITDPVMIPE